MNVDGCTQTLNFYPLDKIFVGFTVGTRLYFLGIDDTLCGE